MCTKTQITVMHNQDKICGVHTSLIEPYFDPFHVMKDLAIPPGLVAGRIDDELGYRRGWTKAPYHCEKIDTWVSGLNTSLWYCKF